MRKTFKMAISLLLCGGMLGTMTSFSALGSDQTAANISVYPHQKDDGHVHHGGTFVRIQTVDATCEMPSLDEYIFCCQDCGTEYALIRRAASNNQPAKGHTLDQDTIETVTSPCGTYQIGTCTTCHKTDAIVGNVKHEWGAWTVEKEATCTEEGILQSKCEKCNAVRESKLGKLNAHKISKWETVQTADCVQEGVQEGVCESCGAKETIKTPALGHLYSSVLTEVKPTCTEAGKLYHACERCGEAKADSVTILPALGHCVKSDNDCTTADHCMRCGTITAEACAEHHYSDTWTHDTEAHFHACTNSGCAAKTDVTAHTGELIGNDCTKGVTCDVCGGVSAGGQHDFTGKVTYYTFNLHEVACANPGCKVTKKESHVAAERTSCTDDVVCKLCGTTMQSGQKNHNFGTYICTDSEHEQHCLNMGGKCTGVRRGAHVEEADDGNCMTPVRCTACNAVLEQGVTAHEYTSEWVHDPETGISYKVCVHKDCNTKFVDEHEEFDSEAHDYQNGKCTVCGMVGERLGGHSLTLDGMIGINFDLELDASVLEDEHAYVEFKTADATAKVNVSEAQTEEHDGVTYHVFTYRVAAKEINTQVSAQLVLSDGSRGNLYTYSVTEYAAAAKNAGLSDKQEKLVSTMMDYGSSAENYFAGGTVPEVSEEVTAEMVSQYKTETQNTLPEGITYEGSSLVLQSTITVRHYFALENEGDAATYGLQKNSSNGLYYKEVTDIPTYDLAKPVDTNVGDYTITYSPMSYVYNVLRSDAIDGNLKNLVKSLYLYSEASSDVANTAA